MSKHDLWHAPKSPFLVPTDGSFKIGDVPTEPNGDVDKSAMKQSLEQHVDAIRELQKKLHAHDHYSALFVFQAMDAAGKDGTIRAVFTGVNPAGFQVYNFVAPSDEELDHDFMWRIARRLPERGRIGVFNRSHYEEVIIVRVHPELLDRQQLPDLDRDTVWRERYESIRDIEKHLARNGTVIVKFFLNVSLDQQKRRLLRRIDNPQRNWKFNPSDVDERARWPDLATLGALVRDSGRQQALHESASGKDHRGDPRRARPRVPEGASEDARGVGSMSRSTGSTVIPPVVLTVAGSDPSGGAGLQADLKTIHQHGAYGAAVATLITAQHTGGVEHVHVLSADLVRTQLASVLDDLSPAAAKTGALGSPEIVYEVAEAVDRTSFPWVVDPVWAPSGGARLATNGFVEAMRRTLVPRATLVTPNVAEAEALAGVPIESLADAVDAARRIHDLGARSVLITAGDLEGTSRGTDVLLHEGRSVELPPTTVVEGEFHGTGCALSSAIAARLAAGQALPAAVSGAKAWLEGALAQAFPVGSGARPVNHLANVE